MAKNIKGIVLCGGKGTRLFPMTLATNKQLLPCGGEPLCYHPIRRLVEAGVEEILVIVGPEHSGQVMAALMDGSTLGANITYKVQIEPKGIAHAIGLGKTFIGNTNKFVVYLGDNVFSESISSFIDNLEVQENGARIALYKVNDPERFGVVRFKEGGILAEMAVGDIDYIVEKPKNPPSKYAVIGLYGYTPEAFSIIERLSPSSRGELEVTDLNNNCHPLKFDIIKGEWIDAGNPESLRIADRLLWDLKSKEFLYNRVT